MAVVEHWPSLLRLLEETLDGFGIEIVEEFSGGSSIYATDKSVANAAITVNSRVTVIVTPDNALKKEFLIEVRSSEPMLKRGTRCEQIASALKASVLSGA
jgi:hypothetical protein